MHPTPTRRPHGLAPEGTGGEGEETEDGADGCGGLCGHISKGMAEDDGHGTGQRHDCIDKHREPGGGDMDKHDAHGFTLLIVGRCGDQRAIETKGEENDGHGPDVG